MAKYPIPVHVAKTESGGQKILTSAARIKELGANAFIVSKASMKKLEEMGKETPAEAADYNQQAEAVVYEIRKLSGGILPAGLGGAVLRGLKGIE